RRALLITTIDGEPAAKTALGPQLHDAGFRPSREGWLRRRSDAAAIPSRWAARDEARAEAGAVSEADDEHA
ncbi:MAG TPA: hypothetical protein VHV30_00035, partial [Polyangiaceae bacterium]|nr:hypothetical protein [Polyangiaceae bacterium]